MLQSLNVQVVLNHGKAQVTPTSWINFWCVAGKEGSSANTEFRMGEKLLGKRVLRESKLEVILIKRLDSYALAQSIRNRGSWV